MTGSAKVLAWNKCTEAPSATSLVPIQKMVLEVSFAEERRETSCQLVWTPMACLMSWVSDGG